MSQEVGDHILDPGYGIAPRKAMVYSWVSLVKVVAWGRVDQDLPHDTETPVTVHSLETPILNERSSLY